MTALAAPDQIDHPALAVLARETQVRCGPVPDAIDGVTIAPGHELLRGTRFLLRTATGYAFFYRRGQGITMHAAPGADPAERELWLNGSIHAAVAAINGLMPFHASAVAWGGRVHAFSGPSGAGKSTLAAALTRMGLPLFCDDTLVIDPATAPVLCLPGHKRLKLTSAALGLTDARSSGRVAAFIDKHYAEPAGDVLRAVLPLGTLTFIEDGPHTQFRALAGGEKIARLADDHHTADLFAAARCETPAQRLALMARLAGEIPMFVLQRPRSTAAFPALAAQVAEWIRRQ